MSKEKALPTAINFRRIFENNPPVTVFKAKKDESYPHSSFLGGFRSKVIFRVTRKYLALRGCDLLVAKDNLFPHAPDGCISGLSWVSLPLNRSGQNHLPMVATTSPCPTIQIAEMIP